MARWPSCARASWPSPAERRDDFLLRRRVDLQADDLELLHERTEGWPAALLLAALWLRSVEDPHLAVERFGGDHRFVADYLSHEVIASLPDVARSFLLRVAVLGRFTTELADDVLGRGDSARLVEELERANLFVVRLEHGGWYRVHSLFAEFAGFQLAADDPAAVVRSIGAPPGGSGRAARRGGGCPWSGGG